MRQQIVPHVSGIHSESKPAASVARAISAMSPPSAVIAAKKPISIALSPLGLLLPGQ
jgi:hypothetical protein